MTEDEGADEVEEGVGARGLGDDAVVQVGAVEGGGEVDGAVVAVFWGWVWVSKAVGGRR